jgi:hypothetical protein
VLAAPSIAFAKTKLIDAKSPKSILSIAKGFGSAKLTKDSEGDPKIEGRMDGVKYSILFYGCENNKACTNIQFGAAWADVELSFEAVNEYNKNKRFGKVYLDDDGDPNFEMDVNIDLGVTDDNFEDTFEWWQVVLDGFVTDVIDKAE